MGGRTFAGLPEAISAPEQDSGVLWAAGPLRSCPRSDPLPSKTAGFYGRPGLCGVAQGLARSRTRQRGSMGGRAFAGLPKVWPAPEQDSRGSMGSRAFAGLPEAISLPNKTAGFYGRPGLCGVARGHIAPEQDSRGSMGGRAFAGLSKVWSAPDQDSGKDKGSRGPLKPDNARMPLKAPS